MSEYSEYINYEKLLHDSTTNGECFECNGYVEQIRVSLRMVSLKKDLESNNELTMEFLSNRISNEMACLESHLKEYHGINA